MSIPPVLRTLLTAPGPSGYETTAAAAFRDAARAFTDDVRGDVMGSSTARIPGTASGRTLAVVGHIDEIGLIVTHIEDTGFLRFVGVGGWDPQVLSASASSWRPRAGVVPGVIGKKPIHLIKPDERSKAPEIKNLHIDIGAADGDGARELVRIGDVAVVTGRARRAAERPRRLAVHGQPARLLRRLRGRAPRRGGGRRARATSSPSPPCRRRRVSAAR